MVRAQRVLEARVRRARIDEKREPELPHVAQPLKDGVSTSRMATRRRGMLFQSGSRMIVTSRVRLIARGPASRTGLRPRRSANFSKFSRNISASFCACASYAAGSAHVLRGDRAPRSARRESLSGTARPNTGSVVVGARRRARRRAARCTIARVWASFMRLPTPYAPPRPAGVHQPHVRRRARRCSLPSISAYFVGCQTRNTAPKHDENVACGSFTPRSVPATFAV